MFQKLLVLFISTFIWCNFINAQCFQVTDGNGALSNNPYYVSCAPGGYTVFIQTNQTIGPYVINWGDGTANATGASLIPPAIEQHTYAATTDTFDLTITNTADGCVVNGVVVLERNPLASIQLPAGDDNFGCTPIQFRFINSSTQVSQTTTFTWDFGDGTAVETYDYTNQNAIVTHTYLPGLGVQSCDLEVRLTATNYCGSSTASFFPLKVWDLDEAVIHPSATLLCFPETTVSYTNNTIRNCYAEGNQTQRYEYWNFGDYWGLGTDSIIDWRPWNPPIINPPPISYPGIGVYELMLIDSSYCGKDTTFQTIEITAPPTALLSINKDTICEGESVTFFNNTIGAANQFFWDFDLGSGFQQRNGNDKTSTYNVSGNYTIRLIVGINGAAGCTDTASVDLYVNPSPRANFTFTPNNQCDSATVVFTNTSIGNIVQWDWDFGNGNTFSGQNPPPEFYGNPGTYSVQLDVENNQGCVHSVTNNIRIREVPVADFSVTSVCLNQVAQFNDLTVANLDPITSYKWYFGDGDSSSAQNPTHLYTVFGTYEVIQIVDNGFCQDSDTLVVVVENNPTADFTPDVDSGCSRLTVNFTNSSSTNATNFIWDFGDGSALVMARDTFHTYTNSSLTDTTFVVEMIALTTFGCADTTYDTITVFPSPVPSFTSDAIVDCGPVTVNFTNTTIGNNLNYFWDFDDGTALSTVINPSHIFENKSLFINNYNVKLIVESSNGCRDTSIQIVTIYPEPIFTFQVVPDSGCSPLNVSFPSVVGAVDYQWDFGDGTTGVGATPSHTYINNTTNDLLLNVRLIAQNSFGCFDTTTGTVLVYPSPVSDFVLDTNIGCQPLPIQITNNSVGANTFDWSFGDGTNSANSNAVFTKTYSNTSALTNINTIQLITRTNKGCADTSSSVVQVHPYINAAYASDSIGCSPFDVGFINQSIGAAQFNWTFGNGDTSIALNPNNLYVNSSNSNQTYRSVLVVTSPQGCIDSADRDMLVYAKPIADFTLSDSSGCHPVQATITNNSINADFCNWTYGDGAILSSCFASNVHTYNNTSSFFPLSYNTELIVTTVNGCKDTVSKPVLVNPQVIADFNSPIEGCSPFSASMQNQSIGGQNYTWIFGDGDSSFNTGPNHLFVNDSLRDTIYQIKLITESQYNCFDSTNRNIEIFAKPISNFSLDTNRGCHPFQVTISNNSSIADSCHWVFGDGVFNDTCFISKVKTYTNTQSSIPANYNTQLFVFTDNGCKDTSNLTVTVNPDIQAGFNSITEGCTPLNVSFNNQSTGTQFYDWRFGDGDSSSINNPNHQFINSGLIDTVYTTLLTVENTYGCQDSISQTITVYPKPIADFVLDTNRGCHPLQVQISDNSVLKDSCRWIFGDGNNLDSCFNTRAKIYSNTLSSAAVNYNLRLFVFTDNGCKDTSNLTVTVNPDIQANFNSITEGCTPLNVSFNNQSTGTQFYDWSFGDGANSIINNPNHMFINTGLVDTVFTTLLTVENTFGCQDSVSQTITIFPKPISDFVLDTNRGCHPLQVQISDNSVLKDSCRWIFGDGNILDSCFNSRAKIYTNTQSNIPVNFNMRLFVYTDNGCSDTSNINITVNPDIQAGFNSIIEGCSPLNVSFQDQSVGVDNYNWNYGDGGNSFARNPSHLFINPGVNDTIFTTKLNVSNTYGCTDSLSQAIIVFPKPIANYSVDVNSGCQPLPVNFSNQSNINDNCYWNFGDGSVDTTCGTTNHTYSNLFSLVPINYQSRLIVETNHGCKDTLMRNILVNPEVIASISGDSIGCSPLPVDFRSQSFGAINYLWNFGDGGIASGIIATNTFSNTGAIDSNYQVRLIASSIYGCNDTSYQNVKVHPTPIPNFAATPGFQTFPNSTVSFANSTNPGNWSFSWDFGDSISSTFRNPASHNYKTWGIYNIKLKASSAFCSDSIIKPITIDVPIPVVEFTDSASGCTPLEVAFQNTSLYGAQFEWDFGDGRGSSTSENPTYTYLTEGEYDVTLRVKGFAPNKEAVLVKQNYIKVYKSPRAGFFINKETVFIPNDPLVLFNTSIDADIYNWDFGDGNSSNEYSPTHFYQDEGAFQIRLIAESFNGCADTFLLPNLVLAELEGSIEIPNAFTPSKNGPSGGGVNPFAGISELNDVFYAKVAGTTEYELNIFNKWGELLFVSVDVKIGWDGYYKGKLCQQDAYVWKIVAKFADGVTVVKAGDLLLLR